MPGDEFIIFRTESEPGFGQGWEIQDGRESDVGVEGEEGFECAAELIGRRGDFFSFLIEFGGIEGGVGFESGDAVLA